MEIAFESNGRRIGAEVENLVIAGWTGRDLEAVEHHIQELEVLGVARPRQVPMFYRVARQQLTTAGELDVVGGQSSGEVEAVLVQLPDGLYVGVGSDHTDREVEAYGVTVSKQVCPKPLGRQLWRFDEVADHWDALVMRSYLTENGQRVLYQEGSVARMLPPRELISRFAGTEGALATGTVMFCGTLPAIGGVRGGEAFELEIHDPVLGRSLSHHYLVRPLPIVD